jgi:hypothetical protein
MSDKDMDASDEELGVLVKDPTQWCQSLSIPLSKQTIQNPVVGPPRTEVTDLPYHNRATPTRSLSNPDIGPAAGSDYARAESATHRKNFSRGFTFSLSVTKRLKIFERN